MSINVVHTGQLIGSERYIGNTSNRIVNRICLIGKYLNTLKGLFTMLLLTQGGVFN